MSYFDQPDYRYDEFQELVGDIEDLLADAEGLSKQGTIDRLNEMSMDNFKRAKAHTKGSQMKTQHERRISFTKDLTVRELQELFVEVPPYAIVKVTAPYAHPMEPGLNPGSVSVTWETE